MQIEHVHFIFELITATLIISYLHVLVLLPSVISYSYTQRNYMLSLLFSLS